MEGSTLSTGFTDEKPLKSGNYFGLNDFELKDFYIKEKNYEVRR